jgi:ribosomal protein S21
MSVNIEVEKSGTETNANLLRRFSKRVQSAGLIQKVKGGRYKERHQSKYKVKAKTLNYIKRRKEVEKLIKLGKMSPKN